MNKDFFWIFLYFLASVIFSASAVFVEKLFPIKNSIFGPANILLYVSMLTIVFSTIFSLIMFNADKKPAFIIGMIMSTLSMLVLIISIVYFISF